MEKTFETPGPVRLRVELFVGDVRVRAASSTTTTIALVPQGRDAEELLDGFTVEQRGDEIIVQAPKVREGRLGWGRRASVDVEVELPERSELDVRTGSGDLTAYGVLGRVVGVTGSGDITVDEVAGGDLKSGSGDIEARSVRGVLSTKTGSGDVSVDTANAALDIVSGSGDITVRRAEGNARAKTGSGDVRISASVADLEILTGTGDVELGGIHGGRVKARTGTGDVALGVVTGVAAYLDLNSVTGGVRVDLDEAAGPEDAEATTSLTVHSGSGAIHVKRAEVTLA